MKKITVQLLLLLASCITIGQTKTYSVIGSSTAAGMGASVPDSNWVNRLTRYYTSLGLTISAINLAQGGRNCYQGMPSSYTPPPGRDFPQAGINVTAALTFNPDVVLVCYPTNNYDVYTIAEIMTCLQMMKDSVNALGKICYITSSQPRQDGFFPDMAARTKLKVIRDSIMNRFGNYAIDFFMPIADPVTYMIRPEYAYRYDGVNPDNIHVNDAGHKVLFKQVRNKDIFGIGLVNRAFVNGNWENPSIWENEEVPTIKDSVVILAGKSVMLNGSPTIRALRLLNNATLNVASSQALKIGN